MGITAESGPFVSYGLATAASSTGLTGSPADYNDQRAPCVADLGWSLLDPRTAYNYDLAGDVTAKTFVFYNSRGYVDYVPITATTSALVANSVVSTGVTTYTITASSSLGTYSTTIIAPETGQATGTVLAIDSTSAYLAFGQSGTINAWNPGAGTGRCVVITTSSSGDGGTWSVAGRDMYGFKMTETLAISQGTTNSSGYTITGQKAFKYISAVANASTPVSTGVSIGLTDKLGFPLKVPYVGHDIVVRILPTAYSSAAAAVGLSSGNAVLASTVATQTSTTPDVRGTYTSTTAANGTLRIQIAVTPSASAVFAVSASDLSPLFGGTQFSSV